MRRGCDVINLYWIIVKSPNKRLHSHKRTFDNAMTIYLSFLGQFWTKLKIDTGLINADLNWCLVWMFVLVTHWWTFSCQDHWLHCMSGDDESFHFGQKRFSNAIVFVICLSYVNQCYRIDNRRSRHIENK